MSAAIQPDMNFCRRCGTKLTQKHGHVFVCEQAHTIYANADPAVALFLFNAKGEILTIERAIDPGKGLLDFPGGFCDGAETLEDAVAREIQEEVGIAADQYTAPGFVLSGIDDYDHGGETIPVLGTVFRAQLTENVTPVADDDAENPEFMPLEDVDIDKVYFPTLRKALTQVRKELANG